MVMNNHTQFNGDSKLETELRHKSSRRFLYPVGSETFTDLCAQLRVRDTRQARHAKVLAFCASATSVQ
jgi:hypothetical protein